MTFIAICYYFDIDGTGCNLQDLKFLSIGGQEKNKVGEFCDFYVLKEFRTPQKYSRQELVICLVVKCQPIYQRPKD